MSDEGSSGRSGGPSRPGRSMRAYWDARARENAMFFIHTQLDYRETDEAAFWASGVENLDRTLATHGLEIKPTDRVVEIGCGMGRITRPLANRACHVVGLDVSAEMIERAQQALHDLPNVELLVGNGCDLDGNADASGCYSLLHCVPTHPRTRHHLRLHPGDWAGARPGRLGVVSGERAP